MSSEQAARKLIDHCKNTEQKAMFMLTYLKLNQIYPEKKINT